MKLAECHPQRKAQARGMCKSCYDKWLKENNPQYKQAQYSNTTKWALANPEKMQIIKDRRKEKEKNDPQTKIKKRNYHLLKEYGITLEEYDAMLERQGGGCKICYRKPGRIPHHVDHCHTTGRVRGILCHQCNWYVGTIDADPGILDRLKNHIEPPMAQPKLPTDKLVGYAQNA